MIEIVYQEEKQQARGNEDCFHLPKNIRQMGEGREKEKIYVEDYVYTFLNRLCAQKKGKTVILLGDFHWKSGVSYFFIRSAAALEKMEPEPDHLAFNDEVWSEVHDLLERYFQGQRILGWGLFLPGYEEMLNERMVKTHLMHFGGNDKTLLRMQAAGEEAFFLYEGGTLQNTGGFYIYYEKNQPMQEYLIQWNKNCSIENQETVPDDAVNEFRKKVEEKQETKERDAKRPLLYAMTACAAVVLSVTIAQKYGPQISAGMHPKEETAAVSGRVQGEKEKPPAESEKKTLEEWQAQAKEEQTAGAEQLTESTSSSSSAAGETPEAEQSRQEENSMTQGEGETRQPDETEQNPEVETMQNAPQGLEVWQEYTIQKGDSLSKISERYYGTMSRIRDICALNQITTEDLIYAGQKIYLPK